MRLPRAQSWHEVEPSVMEKSLVPLKRLDAAPRGAADEDGHEEVVAAERREPRTRRCPPWSSGRGRTRRSRGRREEGAAGCDSPAPRTSTR